MKMLNILFILYYFNAFLFGAVMGSFLNVVAFEIKPNVFGEKKRKSFWKRINRRSHCPHCKKTLGAFELVPILSFLFLKGRCSQCKVKISPQYLLVELFSGIVFVTAFYFLTQKYQMMFTFSFWLDALFLGLIISGLLVIFLFDLRHKIIPNLILYPVFFLSLFYNLFNFELLKFDFSILGTMLLHAFLAATPFFGLWFFSKGRAMGFADWKLIFVLSLFFREPLQILLFSFLSFWIGALYAIPVLLLKNKLKLSSEVPFAPFILVSFFIVLFFNLSYFSFINSLSSFSMI